MMNIKAVMLAGLLSVTTGTQSALFSLQPQEKKEDQILSKLESLIKSTPDTALNHGQLSQHLQTCLSCLNNRITRLKTKLRLVRSGNNEKMDIGATEICIGTIMHFVAIMINNDNHIQCYADKVLNFVVHAPAIALYIDGLRNVINGYCYANHLQKQLDHDEALLDQLEQL